MKKSAQKIITALLAVTLAAGLFSSCSAAKKAAGSTVLNVICWSEYLPQSVLDSFRKTTGVKVNMTTYNSPDEMLTKVQSAKKGTYDMVIGPGMYVTVFNKLNMINKLDTAKIPNRKNLNPQYLSQAYDPKNEYSYPYMCASAVIAVNRSVIKDKITGYQDLLNPKYKNSMVVIEDARAVVGMAEMAEGHKINDTSAKALSDAQNYLLKLKPNIKVFDGASPKTEMINGECPLGLIYGAEAALAMNQKKNIQIIYPKEGVYFGADVMMTFKGGKNTDNAYKLINYILDAKISASISKIFPYANPNKAAYAYLPDSYKNNPAENVPADVLTRTQNVLDIGGDSTKIDAIWSKIKD